MLRNGPAGAAARKPSILAPSVSTFGMVVNRQSAFAAAKLLPGLRIAGADENGPRSPTGLGLCEHAFQIEELRRRNRTAPSPTRSLDDLDPLLAVGVAPVMIVQIDAEHAELDRVPSGHDVEPEAPVADVIGGDHLLGGEHRIDEGHMQRAERRDLAASRPEGRTPTSASRMSCPAYRSRPDSHASARSAAEIQGQPHRRVARP